MEGGTKEEGPSRAHLIIVNFIRVMLVLAFFFSYFKGGRLVLLISGIAFLVTFVPSILEKQFNVKVPARYELLIIFFIYGILLFLEVRGYYADFLVWGILLNMFSAVALGFVGLTVLYSLRRDKKINASSIVIAIFSFCFAVAVGSVWEIFEFALDQTLGFNLQRSGLDTMKDLIVNSIGASLVSLIGYFYIKGGKEGLVSRFIIRLVDKNGKWFRSNYSENNPDRVKELIKKGEGKHLEFKSTLRTNLHTNQVDKKMEHSVLKTIVAYLNSHKGSLLIGVGDNGEILGLQKDNFSNKDKLSLHFTNLIKNHIGNEYLPFIKFDAVSLDGKHVFKVDCSKSNKHCFLKANDNEEFYVRSGPSSVKLTGNALIDYIRHNFS